MSEGDPPVLAPVAGDPGEARRLAAGLGAEADLLAALARTLRGLADPSVAVWASPAGVAFGHRVGMVPGVVERVAHRYAVAAAALRPLADALEAAQAEVAWSQRVHEQAWGPFLRAGDRVGLAESSADPAQRALAEGYRAEMVAQGERVQLAVRRHADAVETYAAADRACATVLRGLLDDGLADTWTYDALTGAGEAASQVSEAVAVPSLFPPWRALGVVGTLADGVQLVADTTVHVAYGDGDLAHLALDAGAAGAGALGPVLKQGARATNAAATGLATTRAARRGLRVTAADRLQAGLAAAHPGAARRFGLGADGVLRRGLGGRRPVGMTPPPPPRPGVRWTAPPRSAAALRPWLHEQATVRASNAVKVRFVDDLSAVLRADGASSRWYAAGLGASATGEELGRSADAREAQLEALDRADLRDSGARHR